MNRRERIIVLLEHYQDVEDGLQDRGLRGDEFVPRMCRAWSHPSYVELRRVLERLQGQAPFLWWHLAETYFRASQRRMAVCPRCDRQQEVPPGWAGIKGEQPVLCNHGKKHSKTTAMVPRMVRRVSHAVRVELVQCKPPPPPRNKDWKPCGSCSLCFIDKQFRGDVFVPDDLLPLAA